MRRIIVYLFFIATVAIPYTLAMDEPRAPSKKHGHKKRHTSSQLSIENKKSDEVEQEFFWQIIDLLFDFTQEKPPAMVSAQIDQEIFNKAQFSSKEKKALRASMRDNYFKIGYDIFWNLSDKDFSVFNIVNLNADIVDEKEEFERLKPIFLRSASKALEYCIENKRRHCEIEYPPCDKKLRSYLEWYVMKQLNNDADISYTIERNRISIARLSSHRKSIHKKTR